jgi:uncharacterized membrane protein YadS
VVSGADQATLSIAIALYIGYGVLLTIFSLIERGFQSIILESFANSSAFAFAFSKASFLACSRVEDSLSFV